MVLSINQHICFVLFSITFQTKHRAIGENNGLNQMQKAESVIYKGYMWVKGLRNISISRRDVDSSTYTNKKKSSTAETET